MSPPAAAPDLFRRIGNHPRCGSLVQRRVIASGGYGHAVGKTLAFAYVEPQLAEPGARVEIEILGARRRAEVLAAPVYDPANERLKA